MPSPAPQNPLLLTWLARLKLFGLSSKLRSRPTWSSWRCPWQTSPNHEARSEKAFDFEAPCIRFWLCFEVNRLYFSRAFQRFWRLVQKFCIGFYPLDSQTPMIIDSSPCWSIAAPPEFTNPKANSSSGARSLQLLSLQTLPLTGFFKQAAERPRIPERPCPWWPACKCPQGLGNTSGTRQHSFKTVLLAVKDMVKVLKIFPTLLISFRIFWVGVSGDLNILPTISAEWQKGKDRPWPNRSSKRPGSNLYTFTKE